jgi:phosphate-selective porin OprO/OprP
MKFRWTLTALALALGAAPRPARAQASASPAPLVSSFAPPVSVSSFASGPVSAPSLASAPGSPALAALVPGPAAVTVPGLAPAAPGPASASPASTARLPAAAKAPPDAARFPSAAPPPFPSDREAMFVVRSGESALRAGGYVQADLRHLAGETELGARRLRLVLAGKLGHRVAFRFMPDFAGATPAIFDAYVDVGGGAARLMAGVFKVPFGLERLQNATSLWFLERGLPTELGPNRDVGAQVHGEPFGPLLRYAVGVFNGTSDGANDYARRDGALVGALHAFAFPLRESDAGPLRGLGLGAAATAGKVRGDATVPRLGAARSPALEPLGAYVEGARADGASTRGALQAVWEAGRVFVLAERVVSTQAAVDGESRQATLRREAWQVLASFAITDDDVGFAGVRPRRPFDLARGTPGALVASARVGELVVGPGAFGRLLDPGASAARVRSAGASLTWALDDHLRAQAELVVTTREGPDGRALAGPERSFGMRWQGRF